MPVSALTADGEMTPQRAAEILASGVPTSEANLIQYVAAKALLSVAKSSDLGLSPANQKYVDILSSEAKQHILYGDSPTRGGHLYPGNPVFPQRWSKKRGLHTFSRGGSLDAVDVLRDTAHILPRRQRYLCR